MYMGCPLGFPAIGRVRARLRAFSGTWSPEGLPPPPGLLDSPRPLGYESPVASSPVPSRRRKVLFAAFAVSSCLVAAVLLSLSLSIPSLVGSPRTLRYIEGYLEEKTGQDVSLGNLTYEGGGRLVARDLSIGKGEPPVAHLPRVELLVTAAGLMRGRISAALLDEPRVFVATLERVKEGRSRALPPVDRVRVTDGMIRFRRSGEEDLVIGPLSASFEIGAGGAVTLRGKTTVPFVENPLLFATTLDPSLLTFSGGELSLGEVKLSSPVRGFPFNGIADIRARLVSAGEGGVELEIRGDLRDVTFAPTEAARPPFTGELLSRFRLSDSYRLVDTSGGLTIRGGEDPGGTHELRYEGSYERSGRIVRVRSLAYSSPTVGKIAATGSAAAPAGRGLSWELALHAEELNLPALLSAVGVKGGAGPLPLRATLHSSFEARGEGPSVLSATVEASCPDLRLPPGSPLALLNDRPLTARASLRSSTGAEVWDVERLDLAIGDLPPLRLRGRIRDPGRPSATVEGVLAVHSWPVEALVNLLGERAPPWVQGAVVEGEAGGALEISGPLSAPLLSGTVSIQGRRLGYGSLEISPLSAEGTFRYGHAEGSPVPLLSGTASIQGRRLEYGSLGISALSAEGTFFHDRAAGPSGQFRLEGREVSLARGDAPPRSLGGVSFGGRFSVDPASAAIRIEEGSLRREDLPVVAVDGRLSAGPEPEALLDLALEPTAVAPLTVPLAAALPRLRGVSLSGTGRLGAKLTLRRRTEGGYLLRGTIDGGLDGGGFSSDDGSRAAEGITLQGSAALDLSLPGVAGTVEVRGRAGGFELLLGRFYGSFRDRAIDMRVSGRPGGDGVLFTVEELDAVLEGLTKARFRGAATVGRGGVEAVGRISAAIPSHGEFFTFFLRDTYGERFPWLRGLETEGRTEAEADVSFRRDGGLDIAGELRVTGAALRSPELDFSLRGVALTLPLQLSTAEGGAEPRHRSYGTLRWQEAAWGGLRLQPGEASPSVSGGDLVFRRDLGFPLLGGHLVLRDLACLDLLGPGRTVRLSAEAHALQMEDLFVALGLPPVIGTLEGELRSLTYHDGALRSTGELTARVFGGTVTFEALAADRLWSPVPSYGLTFSLRDISLAEITGTFGFGHISGILEGIVRDLVIAAGEPQHFEARLETVKRRGVEQKISVEALEKISILGSGGGAGVLSRGIHQFFKEYRYDRMGLAASLENDRLHLSGVHQEGEKTYLVKGGLLPPKADVITYSQEIAFRDMVERLKRIRRVGEQEREGR